MTIDESKNILRIITAAYPNAYKGEPRKLKDAITVWAVIFKDVPYPLVEGALYTYMNDDKEFPPSPGQVKSILYRMKNQNELSEGDAWNMVRRALSNGLYGAQEEFDKLPRDVQKAIGSPQWIYAVASDEDANMSVESSNFYKRYRQVLANKREMECMPPAVRKLLEELADGNAENEVAMLEDKRVASAFEYEERRQKALEAFLNPQDAETKEKIVTEEKSYTDMLKERFANMMEGGVAE